MTGDVIVTPPMVPVQSSNIAALGYKDEQLFVRFHGGALWRYDEVSVREHELLLAAPSVGKQFNAAIKGKKPATKLKG